MYLQAGACYDRRRIFRQCALDPIECAMVVAVDSIYRTSHWLTEFDPLIAEKCGQQTVIQGLSSLGRCNDPSEQFVCTSHETACRSPFHFRPMDPACTVVDDYGPQQQRQQELLMESSRASSSTKKSHSSTNDKNVPMSTTTSTGTG